MARTAATDVRVSKYVTELANMTPNALWETYVNGCDQGGEATPEERPYFQNLLNLIDAIGTFRFSDEWTLRKLAGATHVATVIVPVQHL